MPHATELAAWFGVAGIVVLGFVTLHVLHILERAIDRMTLRVQTLEQQLHELEKGDD